MMTDDESKAYRMILNVLDGNSSKPTEDDTTFRRNTTHQIEKRDKRYTELLKHFIFITRIRNFLKEFFKWVFLISIIISLIVLIRINYRLFDRYINSAEIEQILEAIPLLITSLVGFVSAVISIPLTVTKYLFSTKEDENITQIILHTQEHDVNGRQWAVDCSNLDNMGKNIE